MGLPERIDRALHVGDFRAATAAILALVDEANRLLATEQPWRAENRERAGDVLATVQVACEVIAWELGPFLPGASQRLGRLLSADGPPSPLFARKKLSAAVD